MADSFHYLLMAAHVLFQKRLFELLKESGLTAGQPKILEYLEAHNGVSQKELASGCLIEPASLTSILNRMEEKKLIERRMLNGNRRTFYIFVTDTGRRRQRQIADAFRQLEAEAFDGIPGEQQTAVREVLTRVYGNLTALRSPESAELSKEAADE